MTTGVFPCKLRLIDVLLLWKMYRCGAEGVATCKNAPHGQLTHRAHFELYCYIE